MIITVITTDNHNQQVDIISKVNIAENRNGFASTKKETRNVSYGCIGDTCHVSTLVSNPMSVVPAAIFIHETGHW